MSSPKQSSTSSPPPPPENRFHAFELYGQAVAISRHVKPLDDKRAKVLIEIANGAIKEFGNTNHERIAELKKIISEAEHVTSPATFDEVRKKTEWLILRRFFPKNPILVNAALAVIGLVIILTTCWGLLPYALPTISDDPLDINGEWTYTTTFRNNKPTIDGKEIEAVIGVNSIGITRDRIGYSMSGSRTHYKLVGASEPVKYPQALNIELTRISYDDDYIKFYFHFVVTRDNKRGFVEMFLNRRTPSEIPGEIYYLHDDGTWTIADIVFNDRRRR